VKNNEIRARIMDLLHIVESEISADKNEDNEKAALRLIRSGLDGCLDTIDTHDYAVREATWTTK